MWRIGPELDAPQIRGRPLSDLIGKGARLVICDERGRELREVQGLIVRPGQTMRQAFESLSGPGEHVEIRSGHTGPDER